MPRPLRQFPQNKAELKNRIAVGNTVVDHELVIRAPGGEQFEIIAIYSFKDGLISPRRFREIARNRCRSAASPRPKSSPPSFAFTAENAEWAKARSPNIRQAARPAR